ncbi:uncharacterized protein EV422DRAFT_224332 [Fimicolochytrium jonesii]|uniref:uncharacterized protein n=1 Tax=Fimicolochytrium jonesii TaxID=1396493 RepID=UPI0022FF10D9|nr:uncharacterized protein EV422DRAFT_224332 [Fimicolochytrium jonesii]KAI8817418.1 hypothetical protein EV422DRAFT_224332 [Fimicolochytrium jonesii]
MLANMAEPRSPTSPTSPTFFTTPDLPAIPLDVGDVAGVHGRLKFKHDTTSPKKIDATWIDKERTQLQAYEYLCHIGEAKEWVEACIKDQIAPIDEIEEELRNGIVLARLAQTFQPDVVKKIFEDRSRLQFRHSDNINYFFTAMRRVKLPEVFFFELTDLYDKKNIPKVIYCIHALSHLLSKNGLAPSMKNLVGQLSFTEEQLDATQQSLEQAGVSMPAFKSVGDALKKELEDAPPPSPEILEQRERERFLKDNESLIIKAQSHARRHLAQRAYHTRLSHHRAAQQQRADRARAEEHAKIVRAQAAVRMRLARRKYLEKKQLFKENENSISKIQAAWKSRKQRLAYKQKLSEIHSKDQAWVKLQARYRGRKQREQYLERRNFLRAQGEHVTKIQSMWRAKRFAKAYQALSQLENPQIKVLQNFIELLDDNDYDIEEEIELDRLRQLVVKQIRENITAETELGDLDVKISLLVKNRITLDEVVGSTSKKMKAAYGGPKSSQDNIASINLSGRDKESRRKRKHYEELFYLLQTQPQHLAKLVFTVNKMSGANSIKFLTKVVLSLYGYAQDRRQESLLLSLFKEAINLEVGDITTLDEFWRADPFFLRLVIDYTRRGSNADYLRNLVEPFIKSMLADKNLNLEVDPVAIYRALITAEESATGQKSQRPYEITQKEALEDAEVAKIQSERLTKLKELANDMLAGLVKSAKKMPFGLRFIARQLKETLQKRFPGNDDEIVRLVGGNFIYYRYINPAIIQPEQFEVIDMNVASSLSPTERKNFATLGKALHQMAVGKAAGAEGENQIGAHLITPDATQTFMSFFKEATTVDPETEDDYLDAIDEYAGMALKQRPVVKLSLTEIFQLHRILQDNIQDIAPEKTDNLRILMDDLQPVPAATDTSAQEIELRLRNRFPTLEDERATRVKFLWNETKRCIIAVIKVQTGNNLLDILEAPVTEREEARFQEIVEAETQKFEARRASIAAREADSPANGGRSNYASAVDLSKSYSVGGSLNNLAASSPGSVANLSSPKSRDILYSSQYSLLKGEEGSTPSFFNLKRRALENMAKLEAEGAISKGNRYQDMLNSLAKDMLTKSRRRSRRRKELASLQSTLEKLEQKAAFLEEQKTSYHNYIEACMAQLGNKKHKGKRVLPFTRQYAHQKELQKAGKVPKFGSYKYTAADLYRKGVLVSIDDHSPKTYNQITLTISSDEAGAFKIDATFFGVPVAESIDLRLEDLLASQYNNESFMTLMEGAKVNVNLLIFLLNKKFYV